MVQLENPWLKSYPDDLPDGYNECPFCGEYAEEFTIRDGEIVACDKCGSRVEPHELCRLN